MFATEPGMGNRGPRNTSAILRKGDFRRGLGCEVVNQAERIFDIASWKIRLILDDVATILYQPELGVFDIVNGHFQHRPERRTSFDKLG